MEDVDNLEDDNLNSLPADGLADTNYRGGMTGLLASILLKMDLKMEKIAALHEKNTALLESILGEMKQSNHNKQDENRPLRNGKEISTVHEDQERHFHFKSLPQSAVSLPRAGKKYRLHIVGEVYNHEVEEKKGSITRNVVRGSTFKVEVILKDGDQKVAPSDPFASVRVELVVLDEHWYTEGSSYWNREEFEDHFMMVSSKDKNKMVPKGTVSCSSTRVIVDEGVFSLDGGQVHRMASIKKISERNKKVKLGVMVYAADRGQERVLEGVNKFNVIEKPRKLKEESILGKRPVNSANAQPSRSNSQYSGFPNGINDDIQKILCHLLPAARNRLSEQGILNLLQTQLQDLSSMLQQGCPKLDAINTVMQTILKVHEDISIQDRADVEMIELKAYLGILHAKLHKKIFGASSSAVRQQENYGATERNDAPAAVSHTTDQQQNTGLSEQSYPSSASGMGGHGAGHPSSTPGSGHGGFGGQQHGNMLWRPSYAPTTNSQWTSGLSPTYLGQTNGSNRNFLDQQYIEGYYVVPGEYDNAYAAGGEEIENTYGPYGYGNEGVLATSRPAHMRSPPQQKLADSPLYTVIRSIPSRYLINDYMSMVEMTHQQAMNNEGVMRKRWEVYRRALMMTIDEGWTLYGKNQIINLLTDTLAEIKRMSQEQAMDEIVEMMGRLGTISKSRFADGPYGYGNEGVLARSRPAHMRSPPQQELADSPFYTVIRSIPSGYLINDHYMSMVGMTHQQAMNNEGVMRKRWEIMYRRALMMMIYEGVEGWRLYGKNQIWWTNLIDSLAEIKRISQEQAMDEIVEMMGRLGTISKSRFTDGPYGYGNEGVLARSRPAHMRSPPQQKVADSPLYTVIRSIPSGYPINDHYMSMVAMTHQQAMNNEGVMRKRWEIMYRRALMMKIYEGRRLYGKNQIWSTNLIDSFAEIKMIIQEQVRDAIIELIGLGTISKSRLTTGTRRKTGSKVIVELEPLKQQEVKSQADSLGDGKNNNNKLFMVLDLKATCWDTDENKDRRLRQEIVEFSSVLVDAATGHTNSTFHEYVTPTENRLLSEYCKNYNGIKQEDVDHNDAMSLDKALEKHQAWIRRLTNGNSAAAVVVTWGNWDCRTVLKQECFRKELDIPDYFHRWTYLKTPFAEKYGNGYWNKSVKEALEATELKWEGAIKGGESHAHNKARLLSLLIHQGANLAITSCLDPAAAAPNN